MSENIDCIIGTSIASPARNSLIFTLAHLQRVFFLPYCIYICLLIKLISLTFVKTHTHTHTHTHIYIYIYIYIYIFFLSILWPVCTTCNMLIYFLLLLIHPSFSLATGTMWPSTACRMLLGKEMGIAKLNELHCSERSHKKKYAALYSNDLIGYGKDT